MKIYIRHKDQNCRQENTETTFRDCSAILHHRFVADLVLHAKDITIDDNLMLSQTIISTFQIDLSYAIMVMGSLQGTQSGCIGHKSRVSRNTNKNSGTSSGLSGTH